MRVIVGQVPRPDHGGSIVIGKLSEHELHLLKQGLDELLALDREIVKEKGARGGLPLEIVIVGDFLQSLNRVLGSGDFRPIWPAEGEEHGNTPHHES